MNALLRRSLHGALSGAIGAGCMTVLRMVAYRAGLIEQMVPQAVETWAKHRAPIRLPATRSQRALHHLGDQIMHVGFGATFGALYGAARTSRGLDPGRIAAFGVGVWAFGSFVLLPALKIMRPEWRANAQEIAVNLSAHLLYSVTVAVLTDGFEAQSEWQPGSYARSFVAQTG